MHGLQHFRIVLLSSQLILRVQEFDPWLEWNGMKAGQIDFRQVDPAVDPRLGWEPMNFDESPEWIAGKSSESSLG